MPEAVIAAHGLTKPYLMGEVEVMALRGVDVELVAGVRFLVARATATIDPLERTITRATARYLDLAFSPEGSPPIPAPTTAPRACLRESSEDQDEQLRPQAPHEILVEEPR